ncbi:IS110 family transposase [Herpetosiphon gulosus]|uniref:IS110 family transposase ISOt5 n=1 Tax=Herpetosiphon gulosus TaxID=1973496 RepID=A0ABP9XAB9_9CHLR
MNRSPVYHCFVGIDIAAKTFVAAYAEPGHAASSPRTFDQTEAGFAAFQAYLPATILPTQILIAMEATGSYWIRLAVTLHQAGYAVAVMNPKHIHNFAKSLPRRAKTDALDADVLLRFATERQPSCWTPPPTVYHELRQRLLARDALLAMRTQARNQQHALSQWPVVVAEVTAHFNTVLAALDTQLAMLEREITTTMQLGDWAASATLLLSIPGIGLHTTAWLLVSTLNFTLCATPEAAVAYAGLNPLARESGTSIRGRPRVGRGGNARLRTVLYMATLSASRYNPPIQALYTRLRERGKAVKVARCAAARKLIHLAWAIVKTGQPFDPGYQQKLREHRVMVAITD